MGHKYTQPKLARSLAEKPHNYKRLSPLELPAPHEHRSSPTFHVKRSDVIVVKLDGHCGLR